MGRRPELVGPLSSSRLGPGDQLACRARHPPCGRLPQAVGRQRHLERGENLAGPRSVLRTATQQHHDPVALLAGLLRAPGPAMANLAIPTSARGP